MTYHGTVTLPYSHLSHMAALLRRHQARSWHTRWRKPEAGRTALLVVTHMRNGYTYARLAAGFRICVAAVYRHMRDAADVLAAAPSFDRRAVAAVVHNGHSLDLRRSARLDPRSDRRPHLCDHHHRRCSAVYASRTACSTVRVISASSPPSPTSDRPLQRDCSIKPVRDLNVQPYPASAGSTLLPACPSSPFTHELPTVPREKEVQLRDAKCSNSFLQLSFANLFS